MKLKLDLQNGFSLDKGLAKSIELQEKIIPYIEPVHGVKFVIAQNLTSEMTEAGG